jgi:uncharacterized repeat protein (TIGR03803 family)
LLVVLFFGLLLGAARAQTESVLYTFCAQGDDYCTDGSNPQAGLVFDQKGNLYGTASFGGVSNICSGPPPGCGVVFKLTSEGTETVLYSFCTQTNCPDGEEPNVGVVLDQKGNLYGTTPHGGAHGAGVVFRLTPPGTYRVLHSFCALNNCRDGLSPQGGLLLDQKGNLYGTTSYGGVYGGGVVFKVTPEGKETVLYSFCAQGPPCTDGANPSAGLIFDQEGNLYGTTYRGGKDPFGCGGYGCGVAFKLTLEGKEKVLYSFCAQSGCPDGTQPDAGVVFDRKGNLYGTAGGGAHLNCDGYPPAGCGVVFKLNPEGKETVLYSFCAQTNCTDGAGPYGGLIVDRLGNLYGTAARGAYEAGVVFKLTPKGKETVLYSLCSKTGCSDGADPYGGLVLDRKGSLYGTTFYGGFGDYPYNCYSGCGVVFKLTPDPTSAESGPFDATFDDPTSAGRTRTPRDHSRASDQASK